MARRVRLRIEGDGADDAHSFTTRQDVLESEMSFFQHRAHFLTGVTTTEPCIMLQVPDPTGLCPDTQQMLLHLRVYLGCVEQIWERTPSEAVRARRLDGSRQQVIAQIYAAQTWTERLRFHQWIDYYCGQEDMLRRCFHHHVVLALTRLGSIPRSTVEVARACDWLCVHRGGEPCRVAPPPASAWTQFSLESYIRKSELDHDFAPTGADRAVFQPPPSTHATAPAAAPTCPVAPSVTKKRRHVHQTEVANASLAETITKHDKRRKMNASLDARYVRPEDGREDENYVHDGEEMMPFHWFSPAEWHALLWLAHSCQFHACSLVPSYRLNAHGEIRLPLDYALYVHQLPRRSWIDWQWIELLTRPLLYAGHTQAALFDLYDGKTPLDHLRPIETSSVFIAEQDVPVVEVCSYRGAHVSVYPSEDKYWNCNSSVLQTSSDLLFVPSFPAFLTRLEKFACVSSKFSLLDLFHAADRFLSHLPSSTSALVSPGGSVSHLVLDIPEGRIPSGYSSDCDLFIVGRDGHVKRALLDHLLDWIRTKAGTDVVGVLPGVFCILLPGCKRMIQLILAEAPNVAGLLFEFDFGYVQSAFDGETVQVTPGFMVDAFAQTATASRLKRVNPFKATRAAKALVKGRHVPVLLQSHDGGVASANTIPELKLAIQEYMRHALRWNEDACSASPGPELQQERYQLFDWLATVVMKPENVQLMRFMDDLLEESSSAPKPISFRPDAQLYLQEFSSFFRGSYCLQESTELAESVKYLVGEEHTTCLPLYIRGALDMEHIAMRVHDLWRRGSFSFMTDDLSQEGEEDEEDEEDGVEEADEANDVEEDLEHRSDEMRNHVAGGTPVPVLFKLLDPKAFVLRAPIYFSLRHAYVHVSQKTAATRITHMPGESDEQFLERCTDAESMRSVTLLLPASTEGQAMAEAIQHVCSQLLAQFTAADITTHRWKYSINKKPPPLDALHDLPPARHVTFTRHATFSGAEAMFPFSPRAPCEHLDSALDRKLPVAFHILPDVWIRDADKRLCAGNMVPLEGLLRLETLQLQQDPTDPSCYRMTPLFACHSYRVHDEACVLLS